MKNQKTLYVLILIVLLSFNACQNSEKTNTETIHNTQIVDEAILQKGFEILETNCFTCHSAQGEKDDRIAPPMIAIKKHYINDGTSREQFIKDIVSFVMNPTEEKSKMPGAIAKFNLMPKLGYSEEQITAVAEYLYASEIEQPDWFQKHFETEHKKYSSKQNDSISPLERGQKMALQSKSVLGKNLMEAINSKGTDAAVSFCNEQAFPLLDSMSVFLNAKIKRVSDQPRNANHMANATELTYIKYAQNAIAKNEPVKGEIREENNKMIGYYPITTNQMCLQCHGIPKTEVKENTMKLLSKLYPKDKAVGYSENQLRGIWVVEFDK